MKQPPGQEVQSLRLALLFADKVIAELAGQVVQMLQQFLAYRAGEFGRRSRSGGAQVGRKVGQGEIARSPIALRDMVERIGQDLQL